MSDIIQFPSICTCGKRVDAMAHIHLKSTQCSECIEKAARDNASNFGDYDLTSYLGIRNPFYEDDGE